MSNFIEQQANAFADAHQKQIINKLIQIIDDELETKLETVIDKENKEYKAKYDKFIKTLKTKEEKETYKDLKPEVVTFKNEAEKFSYAFNLLLKEGKTILHDIDAGGQLIVKTFKFLNQKAFKFKSRYTVELNK